MPISISVRKREALSTIASTPLKRHLNMATKPMKRHLNMATEPATAIVKKVDMSDIKEAAKWSHLSPEVLAAQKT